MRAKFPFLHNILDTLVILDVYKGVMHMALHKIDIALGPEATLNALSEKYPERGFLKYRSADDHRKFMLLDVSDEKTVFQSGLNYKVIQTLGRVELGEDDILELRYMTLDSDEQKVMQSIIDSWDDRNKRPLGLKSYVETRSLKQDYEFLLINSWEDEHDFLRWHNSENNTMAQFGHAGNKSAVVNQYVSAGK